MFDEQHKNQETIDPRHFAKHRRRFVWTSRLDQLPDLMSVCFNPVGDEVVEMMIHGEVDQVGVISLFGRIQAVLPKRCERCLDMMSLSLDIPFRLGVVEHEAAGEQLPEQYEPLIVETEGFVAINDLVTEEIMLNLPTVALHDIEACKARNIVRAYGEISDEQRPANTKRPFAGLSEMLN